MKNNKAITLVALIITVIILLILATVSISLIINSGIIDKAKYGVDKYSEEENNEKIGLANHENEMKKYSEKEYVKDGLILHLDGIDNTRNGHSTTTTTWEDLSGNNNDFTKISGVSNPTWSDNSYVGDATNRTLALNKAILSGASECTVEVCYDISQLNNYWVFQNRQSSNPGNGFQFTVSSDWGRCINAWTGSGQEQQGNVFSSNNLEKMTTSIALNNTYFLASCNGDCKTKNIKEHVLDSLTPRNCYTIGSAYPWSGTNFCFKGNIYSIRIYIRKLSEEELKNNYEVDKVRFNMD